MSDSVIIGKRWMEAKPLLELCRSVAIIAILVLSVRLQRSFIEEKDQNGMIGPAFLPDWALDGTAPDNPVDRLSGLNGCEEEQDGWREHEVQKREETVKKKKAEAEEEEGRRVGRGGGRRSRR